MYRRGDPRWNRTIQNVTETLEHANESTQEHLWTFTHDYVNPCLGSITSCLNACTAPCLPSRDERERRRNRALSRGRAELSFDFYDDWDEDERDGLLGGWGASSSRGESGLDRLMGGGTYGAVSQPGRQRGMSYGQRSRDPRYNAGGRRKSAALNDGGPDPTIIPSSSYFGFLGRLPFKIGGKGLRYRPSAADLVEHPGSGRRSWEEEQPLIEESEEDGGIPGRWEGKGHTRQRSHTNTSGHTTDSLSSRGDIFPSEDELDDAVPLDDEFTMALERRTTGQWGEDASSGRTPRSERGRKASNSRQSTRTVSSRMSRESERRSVEDQHVTYAATPGVDDPPTLSDLMQEEESIRLEEEEEIERKRRIAQRLALKRGLASDQNLKANADVPNGSIPEVAETTSEMRRPSFPPHISSRDAQSHETHVLEPEVELPTSTPAIRSTAPSHPPQPSKDPSLDLRHVAPIPPDEQPQTAPDSNSLHVGESDFPSFAPTPNNPQSLKDQPREAPPPSNLARVALPDTDAQGKRGAVNGSADFVPARLPQFG